MRSIVRRFGWLSLVLALVIGSGRPVVRAAELAGIMPQGSVLYLEWSGTDAVRDAHAATALGRLLAEPEMRRFTAELHSGLDRLMVASQGGPELKKVAMGLHIARPLLQHLWHRRVAVNLIGTETTDHGPGLAAALAIELGKDSEGFVTAFQGLIAMATVQALKQTEIAGQYTFHRADIPQLPPIRYGVVDDVFLVTLGVDVHRDILAVRSGEAPALTSNERFTAARMKLGATPANTALVLHVDLVRARAQAKPLLLAHTGSEDFPPPVATLLEELGVNNIKTLTYTGQLADGGFRSAALIAADGPFKGALKLFEAKPLTDEDFHAVPPDAPFFHVCNFDLAAAYDEAVRIANVFAPEAVAEVTAQFEQKTGMKLREDVIALFDDAWAAFDTPSHGGLWFTGITLVVETTDAEAFMKMLERVVNLIRKEAGDEKLSLKSHEHCGHKMHHVMISAGPVPLAPAWGAHGNRVVMALYPQMVAQTLDRMDSKRCVLANPDFVRGRKLLPPGASSVGYVDTKSGAAELYKFFLPAATAGFSFAAANGVPLNVSTIPPRSVMTRHLFGHVSGVSRDDDGIILVSHGPLPIPVPLIGSGGGVASSVMLASIMVPSLMRARELSKRVISEANLKTVGIACQVYAFDHQEQFPPDLETLADDGNVARKQLISPRDPSPGRCSYVYISGQTLKSNPRNVLAHEPDYDGEGGNVLFVNGHVEWIKPPRYRQVIDETYERLGRKPPLE